MIYSHPAPPNRIKTQVDIVKASPDILPCQSLQAIVDLAWAGGSKATLPARAPPKQAAEKVHGIIAASWHGEIRSCVEARLR